MPYSPKSPIILQVLASAVAIAVMFGCNPMVISGKVVNVHGETLPGVAVTIENSSYQALTDALGQYQVQFKPGSLVIEFAKTGYTTGQLLLDVDSYRHVDAAPVTLWLLPPGRGVYLLEDGLYVKTAGMEPELFRTDDQGDLYGVRRWGDIETASSEPMLVSHKISVYETRLDRLHQVKISVQQPQGKPLPIDVWLSEESLPVSCSPIDEPEQHLVQLHPGSPLTPGVYAVHWGALTGNTQMDSRLYLFRVRESTTPAPSEEPELQLPSLEPLKPSSN